MLRDFKKKIDVIEEPVVNLIHMYSPNYYHTVAELLPRVLLWQELRNQGVIPIDVIPLIHHPDHNKIFWEFVNTLGIDFGSKMLAYETIDERYYLSTVYNVDWVQTDRTDPDQNDFNSGNVPSKVCTTRSW